MPGDASLSAPFFILKKIGNRGEEKDQDQLWKAYGTGKKRSRDSLIWTRKEEKAGNRSNAKYRQRGKVGVI
jgi:hypothetical protein